jgi:hypothetical protein
MSYSLHIPLWFGLLKIKSWDRLRSRERDRHLPVWRLGDMYLVWIPKAKRTSVENDSAADSPPESAPLPGDRGPADFLR